MIAAPWNVVLTVLFVGTLAICVVALVKNLRSRGSGPLDHEAVVHLGHAVMSVAMIAMVFWMQSDVLLWAQFALFAVLAVALIPGLLTAKSRAARIDAISHIVLHVAMMWMLAAMPLLMADMSMGGGGHHGGGDDGMLMATPMWATVVNFGFVAVSFIVAVWWLWRAVTVRGHSLHSLCHAAMGVGMGIMLLLM